MFVERVALINQKALQSCERWHLGFVMKLIMRKAPSFSYYEQFSPEAKKYILKDFATKGEELWQSLMQEYLTFSEQSILLRANNSGHYIHLTDFEVLRKALQWLLEKILIWSDFFEI